MTVSAIIPCYRCAGTVRRAVLSVAAQTRRPLELILVDDASGDGTPDALRELREELGRDWIRIVTLESNVGAASARNSGWNAARGKYVAFLDADDSWLPAKLERQLSFMSFHPEFSVTGHLAHYADGEVGYPQTLSEDAYRYREISRGSILLRNPMVTPSLMVKRAIALRFPEGSRHMEDHRFLQEAVFSAARVARLEEVLAVVHKPAFGAGGLSAQLWSMERGELDNFTELRRAGRISAFAHVALSMYSLAKFCRRVTLVNMHRFLGQR